MLIDLAYNCQQEAISSLLQNVANKWLPLLRYPIKGFFFVCVAKLMFVPYPCFVSYPWSVPTHVLRSHVGDTNVHSLLGY